MNGSEFDALRLLLEFALAGIGAAGFAAAAWLIVTGCSIELLRQSNAKLDRCDELLERSAEQLEKGQALIDQARELTRRET